MNEDIKAEFRQLVSALSPENLTCDGELSNARVKKKYERLQKSWKDLEAKVGRSVTEMEAWSFYK